MKVSGRLTSEYMSQSSRGEGRRRVVVGGAYGRWIFDMHITLRDILASCTPHRDFVRVLGRGCVTVYSQTFGTQSSRRGS